MNNKKQEIATVNEQISFFNSIDSTFLAIIEEKLNKATNTTDFEEIWNLVTKVKGDIIKSNQDLQIKSIEIAEKKSDLIWKNIFKGTTFVIGLGLFIGSFFIYPVNPFVGGAFFATGLGALGIVVYLPKLK